MDKTAVVSVIERVRHPKYNKFVLQTKKLYAHDEANDVNVGDKVRVMETRPMSKSKRWRVRRSAGAGKVSERSERTIVAAVPASAASRGASEAPEVPR